MPEALVIIGFQNDFTPAVAGVRTATPSRRGSTSSPPDRFDLVVATRDWHPPEHSSFAARGGLGPHTAWRHRGAQLHPG
jgi:nicotinamidase/pyrazinamidase